MRPLNVPVGPCVGSSVCRPVAPAPTVVANVNVPLLQSRSRIVEALRPSTHSSSCRYETIGTSRAWADVTIASVLALGAALSVWMLTPKAP